MNEAIELLESTIDFCNETAQNYSRSNYEVFQEITATNTTLKYVLKLIKDESNKE